MLKISIITVCYNAKNTIKHTLDSLSLQDYQNIEFILVDGNSNDGTMDIVKSYESMFDIIISENDNGMYEALNKGIRVANGEIIGILNSDDVFCNNNILSLIANIFNNESELSAIIGDVAFVNESNKIIRYCSAKKWNTSKFKFGNMPPHPSFYCRKSCYNKFGYYNTSFKIAGDFELLLRFLFINHINYRYFPITIVYMKSGGLSTSGLKSTLTINNEISKAFKINNLKTTFINLYSRYFKKIFEFLPHLFSK